MKPRRDGKSVLPQLLKEFGFDKAAPKREETVIIIFDELKDIDGIPTPIIKSGQIFTYSTPCKDKE